MLLLVLNQATKMVRREGSEPRQSCTQKMNSAITKYALRNILSTYASNTHAQRAMSTLVTRSVTSRRSPYGSIRAAAALARRHAPTTLAAAPVPAFTSLHSLLDGATCMSPLSLPLSSPAPALSPLMPSLPLVDSQLPLIMPSTLPHSIPLPLSDHDALIIDLPSPLIDESMIIECAVPKKRTSVSRTRHRRAGQRLKNRRRQYKEYRICFVCGTPTPLHHMCKNHMHT